MFQSLLFWKNSPILFFSILYLCAYLSCAHTIDNNDELAQQYIDQYKHLAFQEKERIGVPPSIKLAQGMLETNYGQSKLAIKGKNHFGIKCKNYWKGATIYITDDAPNECFRKYNSIEASYVDHSNFLMHHRNGHYSHLFNLPITDYQSWAKGLKKAGYATNPRYSEGLIRLIKRYHLDELDQDQEQDLIAAVTPPKDPYVSNAYTKPNAPHTTPSSKTNTTVATNQTNTISPSVSNSYTKPNQSQTVSKNYPSKPNRTTTTASAQRIVYPKPKVARKSPRPVHPKPTVTPSKTKSFTAGNKKTKQPSKSKSISTGNNKAKRPSNSVSPIVPKPSETNPTPTPSKASLKPIVPKSSPTPDHLVIQDIAINNRYAVYANTAVLPAFVANRYNISLKKIQEYNNIQAGHKFEAGQPIYLQKKKRRAAKGFPYHRVGVGESMLDIAQKYGIQLANLYKLNKMPKHTQAEEGEIIHLRRKAKRPPKTIN